MVMPNKKELDRVRKKLSKIDGTRVLPKGASVVDRTKYNICKEFVSYLLDNNMSKKELAMILGIDPARVSEIVKYKIELFTIDRLAGLLECIRPSLKLKVA